MKKKFVIILALFVIAIVCCAGCIDPQDPVDPVDPVVPADPLTPVDPVDPAVPAEEYSVMFMLNSGDAGAVYAAETVTAGEAVSKPATPTRTGYSFKGWFTAADGGAAYDFTQPVTADLTLYAQWSKVSSSSSGGSSHSHSYSWKVVKAANCTVDGQKQYVCSCGHVKSTEVIPATGHLETEEVSVPAGTEVRCKACGQVLVIIPSDNELEIHNLEELKTFAETVNAGTDYAEKTVKLMDNIDLSGELWTPIGQGDNRFKGTFEGNDKFIINLKVDQTSSDNAAGFFGVLNGEVQNLKFMNAEVSGTEDVGVVAGKIFNSGSISGVDVTMAEVSGNHYVGGIVGYMYGSVSDCTVDGITLTAVPNAVSDGYDNGDKVGGIAGILASDSSGTISDCLATGVEVTAYRDAGGIVGAGNGGSVTNNVVNGVTITIDQITNFYGEKDVNAAGVIGRTLTGTLDGSNTESDVTIHILYTAKTSENFSKVLKLNVNTIDVDLADSVTYDVAAWETNAMGGDSTATITINGNGKTLTFNNTGSDWNHIVTKNARLIINNAKITNSGHNDGPWNRHDLNFACDVELNNVASDKALAFKANATLTDVMVNDPNTSDTYAIWIQPNGQTVTINGLTIDMLDCTDGRGIKIDNQYVAASDEGKVTLNINGASFKTEEKAAIIVKSTKGADITLSNIDISGVAADSTNAVWVDEASADYYDLVTVTGGTKIHEPTVVYTLEKLQEAVNDDKKYIKFGADIEGDVTVTQKENVKITIDGNGHKFNGDITVDGKSACYPTAALTIKNVNFEAASISKDAFINLGGNNAIRYTHGVTVEDCTFSFSGTGDKVAVKSYTGGDKDLILDGCTVNTGMHSMLQVTNVEEGLKVIDCEVYSKNGINLNNCPTLEMSGCTFDVQGYAVRFGVSGTVNTDAKSFTVTDCSLKSACDDGDAVIIFRDSATYATLDLTGTTLDGATKVKGNTEKTTITPAIA